MKLREELTIGNARLFIFENTYDDGHTGTNYLLAEGIKAKDVIDDCLENLNAEELEENDQTVLEFIESKLMEQKVQYKWLTNTVWYYDEIF